MQWFSQIKNAIRRKNTTTKPVIKDQNITDQTSYFSPPRIGEPYKGIDDSAPSVFYRYDPELSQCIAGYQKGKRNPYAEKLMHMNDAKS